MESRTEVEDDAATAAHGIKRKASTSLESEQKLAKRFDLLNIDGNGKKLYIPVSAVSNSHNHSNAPPPPPPSSSTDSMQVENTRDKVYILDLDAELADAAESDEDAPIFMPDIEKHLTKIPAHVLAGHAPPPQLPRASRENQLVLYNVPASLSVPEERDGVRMAIMEARERARERRAVEGPGGGLANGVGASAGGGRGGSREDGDTALGQDDPDAMEIG